MPFHSAQDDGFQIQEQTGEFFQGWNAISEELCKRLQGACRKSRVHPYIKFVREGAESNTWRKEFAEASSGKGGQPIVNVVMMNRPGFPVYETVKDNLIKFWRESDVEIYVFYSWQNFPYWHKMLGAIATALFNGDRTLNRTCLTYQNPDPNPDGEAALFGGVDCHQAVIRLKVQEAGEMELQRA